MLLPPLGYINLVSDFLPLGAGIVRRRLLDKELVVFLWYLSVAAFTESVTIVLAHLHIVNWWILHVFTLCEYGMVMWVLSSWHTGLTKKIFRASILIFVFLWAISKFTFENFGTPDTYTQTISSMFLLVASTAILLRMAPREGLPLLADGRFWIASGLLLYTAGNLTATLLLEKIVVLNFSDTMIVYQLHWALNICVNIVFAVGYLRVRS